MREQIVLTLALLIAMTFCIFDGAVAKTGNEAVSNTATVITDVDAQRIKTSVNSIPIGVLTNSNSQKNLNFIAAKRRVGSGQDYEATQESVESKVNEALNESKISKALSDYLKSKMERVPCLICGKADWVMPDKIFEVRQYFGGNMRIGGGIQVLPLALVTCQNCGHCVVFNINAIHAGEVKP